MTAERIAVFLTNPGGDSFEELALAAFSGAYESDPAVRAISAQSGLTTGEPEDWRSIPSVAPRVTDAGIDGPGDGLAGLATVTAFRLACLGGLASPPILRLIGGDPDTGHPALAAESLLVGERYGGPGSLDAADSGRLDVGASRSWLAGRQRDGRAAVIVATGTALERLLGALERQDLRFRLALGSRVVLLREPATSFAAFETSIEVPDLDRLGLDRKALIRQYRYRGVPTPCYGRASEASGSLISPPHWLRFSYVESSQELEQGRLAVLDLASTTSPFRIETGDLGTLDADGVRLTGFIS